jgi:putative endonuclease
MLPGGGGRVQPRAAVGRYGEDVAVRHLSSCGYQVVARNWRCRVGEIDVVAFDGPVLVVCEVKTRRSDRFGTPLEAVTPQKAARLRRLALAYVSRNGLAGRPIRIDLVGVEIPRRGGPRVHHLRGVG